jgi:3'(2'), 5'-bisphosphate nucleotidase
VKNAQATLTALVEIAREASGIVEAVYAEPFEVDYKGPKDPVTEADRRANTLICERLEEQFPGVPVVAEESAPEAFAGFRKAERVFFVDPLDGTREFVKRNGEFAVMIGLLDGERASVGVIHAPTEDMSFGGIVGEGAWRFQADGSRTPVAVSGQEVLGEARVVASRSHRTDTMERALRILGAGEIITLGSAGLKGVAVARGDAEAYVAPGYAGKRWDACAADALVSAAGGRFTDAYGKPVDYRGERLANDQGVVATNGRLHDAFLGRLAAARQEQGLE